MAACAVSPLRIIAVLLVLSVASMSCRRGAAPDPPSASPEAESGRPNVSLSALIDAAMERPPGRDSLAVLDRLGEPIRIQTEPRKNRHDPRQVDTLRTFRYAGLQFTVYDVVGSAKEIMQGIIVTDSTYTTGEGVHVGMRRQQIRMALGAPDQITGSTFVYHLSEVTPSELRVALEEGRATRLEWDFYVD